MPEYSIPEKLLSFPRQTRKGKKIEMQRLSEIQFKFTLQHKSTRFNFFKNMSQPLPSLGVELGTLLKIAKNLSSVRSYKEVVPALIKKTTCIEIFPLRFVPQLLRINLFEWELLFLFR